MPRRTWQRCANGKPYAVEWPEWHLDCGEENCNEHLLIAPSGEVLNARDAERRMKMKKTEDLSDGWHKVNGLWYCQSHKIE